MLYGVRHGKGDAHQGEVLRLGVPHEFQPVENRPETRRTAREPCRDTPDVSGCDDVAEESLNSVGMARIEQCITPDEAVLAATKDGPPDQPAPLANRDHGVRRFRRIEIPPPKVSGITPAEKRVRRSHATKEAVVI